ncbi:unnamed protein product [Linum trigynum]|uniref:4Fe-4S ferredoxin-type domain-containing protein n=1 Tax=Linum trigynum TaxID=586398 RepID=A0AAV2FJL8_9ROSI
MFCCLVLLVVFAASAGGKKNNIGAEGRNVAHPCKTVADCSSTTCCKCTGLCVCNCPQGVLDAERLIQNSKRVEQGN